MTLLLLACTDIPADTAPPTLESQSLTTLQHFYEDDASDQLDTLLPLVQAELSDTPHGFYFQALTPEDVDMFEHSDEAIWAHTTGCGVLAKVGGELSQYAAVVPEVDQSYPDPTYQEWTRELTDGTASDFEAGGPLDTWNHVIKDGVGFTVDYQMEKDYRWFGDTLAMISLVPGGAMPTDALGTAIVVGFTIELWTPIDGELVWYNASWTEIESPLDADKV